MSKKMIVCKTCGEEIAKTAKTCPKCGAKNKQISPVKGLIALFILIAAIVIIAGNGKKNTEKIPANEKETSTESSGVVEETEAPVEYTHHDVTELFDALESNAMKAQNTFLGQYVELEGYLGTIDSSGKYITLEADPNNYDYLFDSIHCNIITDEQRQIIMDLSKGDHIVIRGKITDVGEVLGYYLDIDSIG